VFCFYGLLSSPDSSGKLPIFNRDLQRIAGKRLAENARTIRF